MIVEIEKPRPSCRASLDYNEGKALKGVAELVGYANLRSTTREDIYAVFERYERTRYYVSEKSFHASVNPSAADACSEDDVLEFIAALMAHLGYGRQPYLVYRHFDIEREHYHIVSVRADSNGRKINNHFEKRRALAFMREVSARYGFSLAEKGEHMEVKDDLEEGMVAGRPARFRPGKNVTEQLRTLFRLALRYDQDSFRQLSAVLEDFGVRASLRVGAGMPEITLQGLDRKGRPVTEVFSETDLGEPLREQAMLSWEGSGRTHGRRAREKERVRSLVGFAFGMAKSEAHFINILRNKGIGVHLSRVMDTGEVFGVTFVDHSTRTVFKASEMRDVISVQALREAVSSGRWRVEDRGAGRSSYVRRSRAEAKEDAVRLRDLHVGAVARAMAPVGQPEGASWSGRVKPDKEQLRARWDEERAGAMDVDFEDRRFEEKLK